MLNLKKLLTKILNYFDVVMPRVATFTERYTLYANQARRVTITPTQLGLSGAIAPLMVSVSADTPHYNNWFLETGEYVTGTGITISMYSSTDRTESVTVKLLYRQIAS